jgi:hypothetical protein
MADALISANVTDCYDTPLMSIPSYVILHVSMSPDVYSLIRHPACFYVSIEDWDMSVLVAMAYERVGSGAARTTWTKLDHPIQGTIENFAVSRNQLIGPSSSHLAHALYELL